MRSILSPPRCTTNYPETTINHLAEPLSCSHLFFYFFYISHSAGCVWLILLFPQILVFVFVRLGVRSLSLCLAFKPPK